MRSSIRAKAVIFATMAGIAYTGAAATAQSPSSTADDPIQMAAWLAGYWEGEGLGGWNEAFWSVPRAGTMMGVFRHYQEGRVVFYEILTLGPGEGGLVLTLRHFNADLTAWEPPERTFTFPLLQAGPDALHFDGMIYRRISDDEREIEVRLGPTEDQLRTERFFYRRIARDFPRS